MTVQQTRTETLAIPLLGAALVGAGVALLVERGRTNRIASLWPLLLVVLGAVEVGSVGLGLDDADEGWRLIGTGSSLLLGNLGGTTIRLLGPCVIAAAGLAALRGALLPTPIISRRGDSTCRVIVPCRSHRTSLSDSES
jgi:hypothetical protein